jgi:hypothetical protein
MLTAKWVLAFPLNDRNCCQGCRIGNGDKQQLQVSFQFGLHKKSCRCHSNLEYTTRVTSVIPIWITQKELQVSFQFGVHNKGYRCHSNLEYTYFGNAFVGILHIRFHFTGFHIKIQGKHKVHLSSKSFCATLVHFNICSVSCLENI